MKKRLKIALNYAAKGLYVVPVYGITDGHCDCSKGELCTRPGKHPITENGVKDATTKAKTIRAWWQQHPNANVAIAAGEKSGVLVFDLDPRNGSAASMHKCVEKLGPLPITATAKTGGKGKHLLFAYPEGMQIRTDTAGKTLGGGIDVLSNGSYFVAPPSDHASGNSYVWIKDKSPWKTELAAIPPAWVKQLVRKPDKPDSAVAIGVIPEGQRNTALTSLAGTLRRAGMTETQILVHLKTENALCAPPLEDEELGKIAASVASYAPAEANGDPALVLADRVLQQYFAGGRHLLFAQDAFWEYKDTHWQTIPTKLVQQKVLAVIDQGAVGWKSNSSALMQMTAHILSARQMASDDRLSLLDAPPPVINTLSGELWIAADGAVELRPHRPESGLRACLPITYDPTAKCPMFDAALNAIFAPADDPAGMVRHWHELTGYSIQTLRDIAMIIICIGGGANGKTKLWETITRLLGSEQVAAHPVEYYSRGNFAMASLFGKALALDDDVASGSKLPDGILKKMSEGKTTSAEKKFKDSFNFQIRALPVLLCNTPPSLADMSQGMQRRLMVVPFGASFKGKNDDRSLFPRIWASELPGILNRALEGLVRLRKRGRFALPEDIRAANKRFLVDANPLPSFINECCTKKGGTPYVYLNELYNEFEKWNEENGITMTQQKSRVKQNLMHLGLKATKGNKGVKILGIRLK